jgi:AraC-like DNA-binding protein
MIDSIIGDVSATDVSDAKMYQSTRVQTWLKTDSVEAASDFLHKTLNYPAHSTKFLDETSTDVEFKGFTLGAINVCSVQYGVPTICQISTASPVWVFTDLLEGQYAFDNDNYYVPRKTASAYGPSDRRTVRMTRAAKMLNLSIPQIEVQLACKAMLGSELSFSLSFESLTHGNSQHLQSLRQIIGRLANTPKYEHPASRRLESALQDAALFELLLVWPNAYSKYFEGGDTLPLSTRRARDFIHENAAELPSLSEISQAAGVGARALTLSFNKYLAMSPMRYLLQCRLDGVRAELLMHRELGMVTTTAFKWGFFNLGLFAARYRERFGELPHETLRRPGPK